MPVNSMNAKELIDHCRSRATLTDLERALLHALEIKVDVVDDTVEALEKLVDKLGEE